MNGTQAHMHARFEVSSKLSRGEFRDFEAAMQAVINGMQYEHNAAVAHNAELGPDDHHWGTDAIDQYADAAREAWKAYQDAIEVARNAVILHLRDRAEHDNNPEYNRIADALDSGDYSGLAW